MSVFEPQLVTALLRNSSLVVLKDREAFRTKWNESVERRADTWEKLPESRKSRRPRVQLVWESHVVEYVSFVWEKTRPRKKGDAPAKLNLDVPLLGPRFIPPSYLHLQKRTGLFDVTPETQYIKPVNIIHPFYYPGLARCPRCGSSTHITWEGWTGTGARELHGLFEDEVALGLQLRCSTCKLQKHSAADLNSPGEQDELANDLEKDSNAPLSVPLQVEAGGGTQSMNYCWATTSSVYWKEWEHWKIPRGIPIFLHRCGLTRDLFDLIIELRPSSTSGGLAEQVKQLHLLEYHRRMLEYLNQMDDVLKKPQTVASFFGADRKGLQAFSNFNDLLGYDAHCISAEVITEVYLEFTARAREAESQSYMKSLTAICGSLDSTFKISKKATVSDKDCQRARYLKGGILSVINEESEIIAWRFCQTKANAEIREVLSGLSRRTQLLGQPSPEMFVSDNCCAVRSAITAVFPESDSIQDVWHFIARYMATILGGTKNSHCTAVMSDITNAILKQHASESERGARYWDRAEQEQRLVAAYDKWALKGTVWSVASEKVHQEQLRHVRRGCLQRSRQDIMSDGSRIEGCHKAWNMLQKSQPSGIVMLTALSHDFVHRRNIRIGIQRRENTPFVALTAGSHHTSMVDAIAKLYNQLRAINPKSALPVFPELQFIDSGETFGLAPSEHIATFGGLVKEEANEFQLDAAFFQANSHANASVDRTDATIDWQAVQASRDFIFNELDIDPKLLELPQVSSQSGAPSPLHSPNVVPSTVSVKRKAEEPPHVPGADEASERSKEVGTLEHYFRLSAKGPRPPKSRRVEVTDPTPKSCPTCLTLDLDMEPATTPCDPLVAEAPPVESETPATCSQHPTTTVTRSQRLFHSATQIHPDSLTIKGNTEFFLFMEMRAEFHWISYEMTSRKWVNAMEEFNRRLVEKCGTSVVRKHPLALLRKLGELEPRLIERVLKDNYVSRRNSETFWRHHCTVVNLVKANTATRKSRKVPTCSRCKTIMYPGPEKSALNHKRGICADGVRSKSTPSSSDGPLPDWPQPHGIFSDGTVFHASAFLQMVQQVYDTMVTGTSPNVPVIEVQAFLQMLVARSVVLSDADNHPTMVLFQLYPGFKVDSSVPGDRIIQHDGADHLRINYLEQDVSVTA